MIKRILVSLIIICVAVQTAMAAVVEVGAGKWQVSVGSEVTEENVTLEFGYGFDIVEQTPMPPFSAMFGVKDCYLVNPGNFGDEATVSGEEARLAVDVRGIEENPVWVICANSDMTLFFQGDDLNYSYMYMNRDISWISEEGTLEEAGYKLTLKAGSKLALSTGELNGIPSISQPVDNQYVFMWKMSMEIPEGEPEDEIYANLSRENIPDTVAGAPTTINFAAGDEKVKVVVGDKEYVEEGVNADECRWICTINLMGAELSGTPAMADGKFTFTTATAADYSIAMEALATGAAPVTTAIYNGENLVAGINWIIIRFGTLDFDADGDVDNDDAMYFYNFVGWGCPGAEEDWFDGSYLKDYTSGPADEVLNAALETLRSMGDDLDFDGDGDVDNDDAMYLYNFVGWGCPGAAEDWFDGSYLKDYTSGPADSVLNSALESMRGMLE